MFAPIIVCKLKKYGISYKTHDYFASFLYNRQQNVDINSKISTSETINTSVIQGRILGPILFLISVNDLYIASNLFRKMFADDTGRIACNPTLDTLLNFVNSEINKKIARSFRAKKNGSECEQN